MSEPSSRKSRSDELRILRQIEQAEADRIVSALKARSQELLTDHLLAISAIPRTDWFSGEMAKVFLMSRESMAGGSNASAAREIGVVPGKDRYWYEFCMTHASMGFPRVVVEAEIQNLNRMLKQRLFRVVIGYLEAGADMSKPENRIYGGPACDPCWWDRQAMYMAFKLLSGPDTCTRCDKRADLCLCDFCGLDDGSCKHPRSQLPTSYFAKGAFCHCGHYNVAARKYAELRSQGKWTGGWVPPLIESEAPEDADDIRRFVCCMSCGKTDAATHPLWMER